MSANTTPSFSELCSLFETLSADETSFLKLDAFAIDKIASKKKITLPPWFKGIVRGVEKVQDKMRDKLSWLSLPEHAEMASHYKMSHARFGLLKEFIPSINLFYFPTCGLGLDAFEKITSTAFKLNPKSEIILSDIDPLLTDCIDYNFSKNCTLPFKTLYHNLTEPLPFSIDQKKSYCFADPSRRKDGNKFEKGTYEPDLNSIKALLEKFDFAQIKLSAGESIEKLQGQFPNWHWCVLALGREVKEIFGTWILNSDDRFKYPMSCIRVSKDSTEQSFYSAESIKTFIPSAPEINNYLYFPHIALVTAQLTQAFLKEKNISLNYNHPYYSSNTHHALPFFDIYKVVDQSASRAKNIAEMLKKYPDYNIEIINKENPLSAQDLKKLHKSIPEHQSKKTTLSLMPSSQGKRKVCFLLEKINK